MPLDQVAGFEKMLLDYFGASASAVRDELAQSADLSDDLDQKMAKAIESFKAGWTAG